MTLDNIPVVSDVGQFVERTIAGTDGPAMARETITSVLAVILAGFIVSSWGRS